MSGHPQHLGKFQPGPDLVALPVKSQRPEELVFRAEILGCKGRFVGGKSTGHTDCRVIQNCASGLKSPLRDQGARKAEPMGFPVESREGRACRQRVLGERGLRIRAQGEPSRKA